MEKGTTDERNTENGREDTIRELKNHKMSHVQTLKSCIITNILSNLETSKQGRNLKPKGRGL